MRMLKAHQRRGERYGANLHESSINKRWKGMKADSGVGNKPLPEAGQVENHKGHLLNQ
jgi:hypothetical protein